MGVFAGSYHIERHDVVERYLAVMVCFHKTLVHLLRAATGRQTQYEGPVRARIKIFDTLDDVLCDVLRSAMAIVPDDKPPVYMSVKQRKIRFTMHT